MGFYFAFADRVVCFLDRDQPRCFSYDRSRDPAFVCSTTYKSNDGRGSCVLSWLFAMRLPVFILPITAIAHAFLIPPEIPAFTGLSPKQLQDIVAPRSSKTSECAAGDTSGGIFKGPGVPDQKAIARRNAFVKRRVQPRRELGYPNRLIMA